MDTLDQLLEDLETVGLANERIILNADQEESTTDVQRGIGGTAHDAYGTAIEQPKVGDSISSGKMEGCIQEFRGFVRALSSDIESKVGSKITISDPSVPWIIRQAAGIITRCRIREHERTAYRMMKGRRSNTKRVPLCPVVIVKIPKIQYKVGDCEDR